MTLLQLQYFRAIAETQHFTKAAEKLMISQSNLSHSIKELEEELGVKLFMRQGRNVALTKYGEMFLPYVNQSLKVLKDGISTLENYTNPNTGTIVLATSPSLSDFTSYITVRYLSETGRTGVRFQIIQEGTHTDIVRKLSDSKVDFAFSGSIQSDRIAQTCVGYHELVVLVSRDHPLASSNSIDLHQINGEKFIPFDHTCQLRAITDRLFEELDIHPQMSFETAQDQVIYALVAANQGVSIVPRPMGRVPFNIKVLHIKNDNLMPRQIHLSWNRESYLSPAAERFRDFIRERGNVFDQYVEASRENSSDN